MLDNFHPSWEPIYKNVLQEPLRTFIESLNTRQKENIFRVFKMPVNNINIVILGEEPEILPGVSNGLAYARREKFPMNYELINIKKQIVRTRELKVLNDETDEIYRKWTTLKHWEEQGVFLLNISLTKGTESHFKHWANFMKSVVHFISTQNPCIWMLFGSKCKKHKQFIHNKFLVDVYNKETIKELPINSDWNYIITATYPASGNFIDGKQFLFADTILKKTKSMQITW